MSKSFIDSNVEAVAAKEKLQPEKKVIVLQIDKKNISQKNLHEAVRHILDKNRETVQHKKKPEFNLSLRQNSVPSDHLNRKKRNQVVVIKALKEIAN